MNYSDIPRSLFERAQRKENGGELTVGRGGGYFADAMGRFAKNRAAITAAVLIKVPSPIIIFLYEKKRRVGKYAYFKTFCHAAYKVSLVAYKKN